MAALATACPGIEEAYRTFRSNGDDVAQVFMKDGEERRFDVRLSAHPTISPATLDDQIDIVNECRAFTYAAIGGYHVTTEMEAARTDDYGEATVTFTMHLSIESEAFSGPLKIAYVARTFLVDTVSATIAISADIGSGDAKPLPLDTALLDAFSIEMENRVADLLAG